MATRADRVTRIANTLQDAFEWQHDAGLISGETLRFVAEAVLETVDSMIAEAAPKPGRLMEPYIYDERSVRYD